MRRLPLLLASLALCGSVRAAHADEIPAREKLVAECGALQKDHEATASPKLLASLGLCAVRLERDGEAIDAYSRYLREDPDLTGDEHDRIVRDLQLLTTRVGYLTIKADQAGVMIFDERIPADGETVMNEYGPVDGTLYLRIRPGRHMVTAKAAGYEDSRWEVDASSGAHVEHIFAMKKLELALAPPHRPGRRARYGPWLLMGLGGSLLVAGTVTGIATLAKKGRIENHCPDGTCPGSFDLAGERSAGKTLATATDVLLMGGAVAAAGGLTWLLLERRSQERLAPAAAAACTSTGCAATLRLSF